MFEQITVLKGKQSPLGLSFQGDEANFALFSKEATQVILGLFIEKNGPTAKEIPLYRSGDIWHVALKGKFLEGFYAFRCQGPYDEKKGLLFKSDQWLVDPYAKRVHGRADLKKIEPFDWQGIDAPQIPLENLVIYEMHIRGFTCHSSSNVKQPGKFLGLLEKIPHLKQLGINAVELLPVFSFNEICSNINPKTKKTLTNYWGYQPLHFFVPTHLYSVDDPVNEFKTMVRELHRNGIAVILDVVVTHTGEGDNKNFYINFRGIENETYYMIDPEGMYRNFSGCGNTLNCNHPIVQEFILNSLRYWITEMHIDGFRFDSASIFMRDTNGNFISDPPILQAIAKDPILNKVKLIAEPWDAKGDMQIGSFANNDAWMEWNSHFRDIVRRFMKGDNGQAPFLGSVLAGSHAIYKTPLRSVNYVTAHDGFSLRDLVTYNQKHNEDNGEMNRDGNSENNSWNCGVEGPTENKNINALRERQMRNFFLLLFLSQGVPMFMMGDEYGHTRFGNNNPYVQDNEVNWFLWNELEKNKKIFNFVSALIAFRKKYPGLRHNRFLMDSDIEWHGNEPFKPDWSSNSKLVALTLKGSDPLYMAFNSSEKPTKLVLPPNTQWQQVVNTAEDWSFNPGDGRTLSSLDLLPFSAFLAIGRSK